jgi:hypothetical protein
MPFSQIYLGKHEGRSPSDKLLVYFQCDFQITFCLLIFSHSFVSGVWQDLTQKIVKVIWVHQSLEVLI